MALLCILNKPMVIKNLRLLSTKLSNPMKMNYAKCQELQNMSMDD